MEPLRGLWGSVRKQRGLTAVAAWSVIAAVLARGANLAALAVCARLLGKAEFGMVAAIQSTVGMLAPFASMGLALTTTKFVSEYRDRDPERAGRIVGLALWAATVSGTLMSLALIALAPRLAVWGFASPELTQHIIAGSGLLALGVIEAVQNGILAGLEAFSRIAKLSAWTGIVSLPVTVALTYRFGTTGAIASLTVALGISCVWNAIAVHGECAARGIKVHAGGWRSERGMLFSFSLPAYLSGILVAPVTWFSATMLVKSSGFGEMAAFSASDRFRFVLIFVPLAVSRVAVPVLSRLRAVGDDSGYRSALRWNLGFAALATAPAAVLCALFSRQLLGLFGAEFPDAWPVLVVLALSAIPTVMNTQLGAAVLSNNSAWSRTLADSVLAVVFLAASLVCVPRWHALGLAASLALAYSCACVVLWTRLSGLHERREAANAA